MATIMQRAVRRWRSRGQGPPPDTTRPDGGYAELAARVAHLEMALQDLQDAVYRQDVVHDKKIAELSKRRPGDRSARHGE